MVYSMIRCEYHSTTNQIQQKKKIERIFLISGSFIFRGARKIVAPENALNKPWSTVVVKLAATSVEYS